jgi:hypothetical protein
MPKLDDDDDEFDLKQIRAFMDWSVPMFNRLQGRVVALDFILRAMMHGMAVRHADPLSYLSHVRSEMMKHAPVLGVSNDDQVTRDEMMASLKQILDSLEARVKQDLEKRSES